MSGNLGGTGAASYRAGSWFAVFGSKVTVLLPESQKDQVVSLWALVDGLLDRFALVDGVGRLVALLLGHRGPDLRRDLAERRLADHVTFSTHLLAPQSTIVMAMMIICTRLRSTSRYWAMKMAATAS